MFHFLLAFALFFTACSNTSFTSLQPVKAPFDRTVNDPHSFANINDVRVTHLELFLTVKMDEKILRGLVVHNFVRRDESQQKLILDVDKTIKVKRTTLIGKGQPPLKTTYVPGQEKDHVGKSIVIDLEPSYSAVAVEYETDPMAAALSWIPKEQTNGKTAPFLYTQGESTNTRSWIPCQDSPSVRTTFSATIGVPEDLLAVMSTVSPKEKNKSGTYTFEQKIAVPSYLITLAVGDLVYAKTGKVTGVYAEPIDIEMAKKQFANNDEYIDVAESLYGPYSWGEFNLLIMPPNYPYGGMENPSLIYFARFNLDGTDLNNYVVAHELAHFWFGNMVTNATWEDFWLNEGPTTYAEGRISEVLYRRQGDIERANLAGVFLEGSLHSEMQRLPKEATSLYRDLKNVQSDDGLTIVPYGKGMLFLRTLEAEVGRDKLDQVLRGYLEKYKFQSVDSKLFEEYVQGELVKLNDGKPLSTNFKEWIYGQGMPNDAASYSSTKSQAIIRLYTKFKEGGELTQDEINQLSQSPVELSVFMSKFPTTAPDKGGFTHEQIQKLDAMFGFSNHASETVKMRWYARQLGAHYEVLKDSVENFMMKSIVAVAVPERFVPSLVKYPDGLKLARKFFDARSTEIHNMNRDAIREMIEAVENPPAKE